MSTLNPDSLAARIVNVIQRTPRSHPPQVEVVANPDGSVVTITLNGFDVTTALPEVRYEHDEYLNRLVEQVKKWEGWVPTETLSERDVIRFANYVENAEREARQRCAVTNVYVRIDAALKWLDVNHTIDLEKRNITIDGEDVSDYLNVRSDTLRVAVGSYDNKTHFPVKKDGTHSYDRIASLLAREAKLVADRRRAERARSDAKTVVEVLRQELGVPTYGFVNSGGNRLTLNETSLPERPVQVRFQLMKNVTVDEARAIHAALRSAGLLD